MSCRGRGGTREKVRGVRERADASPRPAAAPLSVLLTLASMPGSRARSAGGQGAGGGEGWVVAVVAVVVVVVPAGPADMADEVWKRKNGGGGGGGAVGAGDGGKTTIFGRVSPSPRSPCRPTPPHSSSLFANHAGSLCPAHRHHHRPPAGGVHAAGPARDAADTAAAGDGDGPLVSFKKGPGGGADAVPARCCPLGQDRPGIGPVCAQCEQGNQGTGNARGAPACATGTARG